MLRSKSATTHAQLWLLWSSVLPKLPRSCKS